MTWTRRFTLALLALLAAAAAPTAGEPPLRVRGAALLGEPPPKELLPLSVDWVADDPSASLLALLEGTADVAVTTRALSGRELELASGLGLELDEHVLGLDGLAVVVHPDNPVEGLSVAELAALFTGEVRRWHGVGGPSEPIHLVLPSPPSGITERFRETVLGGAEPRAGVELLESDDDVLALVAGDRSGLGVTSLAADRSRVKTLAIAADGEPVSPHRLSIQDGSYPLRYAVRIYRRVPAGAGGRRLLAWLLLQEGRGWVASLGLVPLAATRVLPAGVGSAPPPPVDVTRVDFGYRGSRLGALASESLLALSERLRASGEGVWVMGHSEPTEVEAADLSLATARAEAVARFLTERGVAPGKIVAEGLGALSPRASNLTLEGRRANRRADVWVLVR
jgi:phosphate transport system substrate-binding protein